MSDLRLSPSQLRELGSQLSRIAAEFDDANARSDRIAGAVGHSGLAGAITDFAHEWDDTRKGMVGDIRTMSQAATAIGDAFEDTDGQLADALTAPPESGTAAR